MSMPMCTIKLNKREPKEGKLSAKKLNFVSKRCPCRLQLDRERLNAHLSCWMGLSPFPFPLRKLYISYEYRSHQHTNPRFDMSMRVSNRCYRTYSLTRVDHSHWFPPINWSPIPSQRQRFRVCVSQLAIQPRVRNVIKLQLHVSSFWLQVCTFWSRNLHLIISRTPLTIKKLKSRLLG